ncbi:acyl carrier protein [Streptomyces sp. NPDC023838]|uniref:acyl carrier protein n=1 Tax=Streptomyces sp. NPDC023838 TaxID=3154325 RepID=UPI00340A5B06
MEDEVVRILTHDAGLPAELVSPSATLAKAGVDSMALAVLSMVLEDAHGVVIGEHELGQAATVGDLASLVADRKALA